MGKFTQLETSFDLQQSNWIRWAGGKGYLAHLWWQGSMTRRLQAMSVQLSESASDSLDPIAELDADVFNKIVKWLPIRFRNVYLAHIFNKVVMGDKTKPTKPGDIYHQCVLLGLTKYRYEQHLEQAIGAIKRQGGLV